MVTGYEQVTEYDNQWKYEKTFNFTIKEKNQGGSDTLFRLAEHESIDNTVWTSMKKKKNSH